MRAIDYADAENILISTGGRQQSRHAKTWDGREVGGPVVDTVTHKRISSPPRKKEIFRLVPEHLQEHTQYLSTMNVTQIKTLKYDIEDAVEKEQSFKEKRQITRTDAGVYMEDPSPWLTDEPDWAKNREEFIAEKVRSGYTSR